MDTVDNIQRQLDEAEAIESMYNNRFEMDSKEARALLESWVEAETGGKTQDSPTEAASEPPCVVEYTVWLSNSRSVGCRFRYPVGYPEASPPDVTITVAPGAHSHYPRSSIVALSTALQDIVRQTFQEAECALQVVISAEEAFEKVQAEAESLAAVPTTVVADERKEPDSTRVGRRLIWSHHIKSTTKKKQIVAWASELKLSGYCKPGYPGIILVEGLEDNVSEYLQRLRRLTWKALVVKGTYSCVNGLVQKHIVCLLSPVLKA